MKKYGLRLGYLPCARNHVMMAKCFSGWASHACLADVLRFAKWISPPIRVRPFQSLGGDYRGELQIHGLNNDNFIFSLVTFFLAHQCDGEAILDGLGIGVCFLEFLCRTLEVRAGLFDIVLEILVVTVKLLVEVQISILDLRVLLAPLFPPAGVMP